MKDPMTLKRGDACPNCRQALVKVPVPTDDERRRAADRDHPEFLNPALDTATVEQRQELGELYRCVQCGYKSRFAIEAAASAS